MFKRSRYPIFASAMAIALLVGVGIAQPPDAERPRGPRSEAAEKRRGPEGANSIDELKAVEADLRAAGNTEAADRIAGVVKRMEQRAAANPRRGPGGPDGPDGFGPPPGGPPLRGEGYGPPPGGPPPPRPDGFGPPPPRGPEGRPRFGGPEGGPPPLGAEAVPPPVREAYKNARSSDERIQRLERKLAQGTDTKGPDKDKIEADLVEARAEHAAALTALNAQAPVMRDALTDLRDRLEGLSQAAGDDQEHPRLQEAIKRLDSLSEAADNAKADDSPELYKMMREQSNFLQRQRSSEEMPREAAGRIDRMRNEMQALRDRLDRLQGEIDTLEAPPPPAPPRAEEAPLPPIR